MILPVFFRYLFGGGPRRYRFGGGPRRYRFGGGPRRYRFGGGPSIGRPGTPGRFCHGRGPVGGR